MARSVETITQKEIDAYKRFVKETGLVDNEKNAGLVGNLIASMNLEINSATLKMAFAHLQPQLEFESVAQREYNTIAALFTQAQLDQFESWLAHQRLVSDESDQGLSNRALLLQQLRGRGADFSDVTFAQALGRVANNASRPLFMKPEPTQEHYGVHSAKKFEVQESVKLSVDSDQKWDDQAKFAANGRVNHAHTAKAQPANPSAKSSQS
jgi:hypothetical protein